MTRRTLLFWLAGYLASMAAIFAGLRQAHERIMAESGSPEALAAWRDWAEETRKAATPDEPVERRPVKSDEPPLLILMRDHFTPIVATSLVIGTFLFAFLGFLVMGIARDRPARQPRSGARSAD